MVKEVKCSVLTLTIIVAVVLLLCLFWVYVRNTRRLTSTLDKKTTLAKIVLTLTHVFSKMEGICTNTPAGDLVDASKTPALCALMHSLESSILKMDSNGGSGDTYLFIYDTSGNKILDSDGVQHVSGSAVRITRPLPPTKGTDVPVNEIIKKAANGGGFVEFVATNPQTKKKEKKITYVRNIPGTHWILGSGMYVAL